MMARWFVVLAFVALLTGCASVGHGEEQPAGGQPPSAPQVSTPARVATGRPPLTVTPRPAPTGTPREMRAPGIPPKVYNTPLPFPQPDDANLQRGPAYLTAVQVAAAQGGKVLLQVQGNLPTPCHALRVAAVPKGGRLDVTVYSVVAPGKTCAQVLQPFGEKVALGPFPDGKYQVWVNGKQVGVVTVRH